MNTNTTFHIPCTYRAFREFLKLSKDSARLRLVVTKQCCILASSPIIIRIPHEKPLALKSTFEVDTSITPNKPLFDSIKTIPARLANKFIAFRYLDDTTSPKLLVDTNPEAAFDTRSVGIYQDGKDWYTHTIDSYIESANGNKAVPGMFETYAYNWEYLAFVVNLYSAINAPVQRHKAITPRDFIYTATQFPGTKAQSLIMTTKGSHEPYEAIIAPVVL
jgi:hypothetical protein